MKNCPSEEYLCLVEDKDCPLTNKNLSKCPVTNTVEKTVLKECTYNFKPCIYGEGECPCYDLNIKICPKYFIPPFLKYEEAKKIIGNAVIKEMFGK